MSEYQYYEFQTIDRQLTEKERDELRDLSTRATITRTSFTNEYHFGSFKGCPGDMVADYFDAFVYYADWGTRWAMLKIPKNLFDTNLPELYFTGDSFGIYETDKDFIFEFIFETDDYIDFDYDDCNDFMASLKSLRVDLIRGDYRTLYLAWLLSAMNGEIPEEEEEPPVPPNLGDLSVSLKQFADFFQIPPDLINAAAANSITRDHSDKIQTPSEKSQ